MPGSAAGRPMTSERMALAAVLALYLTQACVVSAVLPPWQDADSPTHLSLVQYMAQGDRTFPARWRVEAAILQSMATYRWWEPYEQETPNPVPRSFREMRFGLGTYGQPLYYLLGAAVLRVTRPDGLEAAYWHLRALSIVISLAALAMGWAGTRLMFGPGVALGATAVAALYPQFMLAGIAVNPNVLAAAWGAFVWWQIGRTVSGRTPALSLALVVTAAVAVVFTKRSAIPFAIGAGLVALELFRRESRRWGGRRAALGAATMVIALATVAGLAVLWQGGALFAYWGRVTLMLSARTYQPSEILEYVLASTDHTWFIAGWHRYLAPEPWQSIGRGLAYAGMAGAVMSLVRPAAARFPVAIAWTLVIAQVVLVLAAGLWGFLAPHGRYAETVLAPMAVLLWLGCERVFRPVVGRYAGIGLVAVLAIMDVGLIAGLLIPAYFPW